MIATQGHRQLTVSFMLSNKKNNANFTSALYDGVSPAGSPPAQDFNLKPLASHVYEVYKLKYRTQLLRFEIVDVQMIEDAFVDAYLKVHYV